MKKILLSASLAIFLASCSSIKNKIVDQLSDGKLTLNLQNLEDLGDKAKYEGWIIVDGKTKTTGTFTVNSAGKMSQTEFNVNKEDLLKATDFVLTIEPNPDTDTAPSKTHILAGKFIVTLAPLTAKDEKAIGADFTTAKGGYILRTPTDGNDDTNEESGVWFLDPTKPAGSAGSLTLPTLPEGWRYEGWAVINDKPVSTGVFAKGDTGKKADTDNNPYGAGGNGPNYPGEDFLKNAPTGFTFPTDLKGQKIVVSVEPYPDNSPKPFSIKPLIHNVPSDATTKTLLTMTPSSATLPTGTATK